MNLALVAIAVFTVAFLFVASRNATTLCVLEVEAGVVRVKRGGLAAAILSDIGDVVRHPPIRRATVRVSRRRGYAEVEVTGDASDAQRQQLRNVVGRVPLAQLINRRGR